MKLSTIHEKDNVLAIRVQDVTAQYINTIRRYATSRVPTMAIDFVEFHKNSGLLYDEMIAHRLGLIPLTTDLDNYNLIEEEWTEPTEDPRAEVQLTLKSEQVKEPTVIYAKDLVSKDDKITPVYPDMPITKLIEGQEIELVATARLGLGEEHVKWNPGHIWYRHFPHISIDKQPKNAKELAQRFPNVFTYSSSKLALTDDAAYHFPDTDLDVDGITVEFKDNDYILIIESWGQLAPKEILTQAISAYDNQLDDFTELAKDL